MAKRRKPKNNDQIRNFNKRGGFSAFDKACKVLFNKLDLLKQYNSLFISEKRSMFTSKVVLTKPVAAKGQPIPSKELQKLGDCIQKKIRVGSFQSNGNWFSAYELQLFWLLRSLIDCKTVSANRKQVLMELFGPHIFGVENFAPHFFISISKAAMSLSSIDTKYYSIGIRDAAIVPDNPEMEMSVELYLHPARKKHIKINNVYRPAFAIGLAKLDLTISWLKLNASLLKGSYCGQKEELPVYMQSHANKRLKERLDLLDSSSVYYTIWLNTIDMDKFIIYKDYLLFPYELHDCKVGYLVADVIDDLVVFKTFLFITHSSTPEGDKLKEVSGLSWKDISYWKIDRLSTFLKTDTEKYPGLTAMFKEAGLGDLFQLKDLDFDIDTLQDANLDALRDYINQGKQELSMEFA
jgi:hypothetical protein